MNKDAGDTWSRIGAPNEAQTSNYARIIIARSLHLMASVLDPPENRHCKCMFKESDLIGDAYRRSGMSILFEHVNSAGAFRVGITAGADEGRRRDEADG